MFRFFGCSHLFATIHTFKHVYAILGQVWRNFCDICDLMQLNGCHRFFKNFAMTAQTLFWKKIYVLSDLILGTERPYVARVAKLTSWFFTCRSKRSAPTKRIL